MTRCRCRTCGMVIDTAKDEYVEINVCFESIPFCEPRCLKEFVSSPEFEEKSIQWNKYVVML